MRIMFLIPHLADGGAEREVAAFANALAHLGEDVCIAYTKKMDMDYAIDPQVRLVYLSCDSNVPVPKLRGLCNTFLFFRQMYQYTEDVLIAVNFSPERNWWVWTFALFSGTKMVYAVINNMEKTCRERKQKRYYERICRRADAIWIQTEGQRKFLPGYAQKKTFLVRNILERKFLNMRKARQGEILHFISVGRLHPQKNQEMLVEAFAGMVKRTGNQDATLTIYGKENQKKFGIEEKLRMLIQKYQLEDRILLPGRVREIEKYYERADAFVFGSDYEGLPNALMEAMAAGLPCISTDCPTGPSDLIRSGENGILVPVGDVEAMSQAMELLVKHPDQAEKMGRRARQTMLEWEGGEKLANQLLTQLKRICR